MTRFRSDGDGDSNTFELDVSWTQFSHRVLPSEKGTYAQTYQIKGESDGTMKYKQNVFRRPVYSKILKLDTTSGDAAYLILYNCKQDYFDLYTSEYIQVLTPDGTISDNDWALA